MEEKKVYYYFFGSTLYRLCMFLHIDKQIEYIDITREMRIVERRRGRIKSNILCCFAENKNLYKKIYFSISCLFATRCSYIVKL